MRRQLTVLLSFCVLLLAAIAPAAAGSVHLKGGKKAEPSFLDWGLNLQATGELSGLSSEPLRVSMTANAEVITTCTNNGGNQAPGQDPAPIVVTGSATLPGGERRGNSPFDLDTDTPQVLILGAPDCPNPNWVERVEDLAFTSATITFEQPPGTPVLTVFCSFDPPTSDGSISKRYVTCSQS